MADAPSDTPGPARPARERRAAAPFRRAEVVAAERVTPRLVRVALAGPELVGLRVEQPASSVRLYVPRPDAPREGGRLVLPEWDRNNFAFADGTRPTLRTLTPLRVDPERGTLDLEVVTHGDGPASRWAEAAAPGDETAVSGPARGWDLDAAAPAYVLAGDETALPAVGQLLEALAALDGRIPVRVVAETATADARPPLPHHPGAEVTWLVQEPGAAPGAGLVDAVRALDLVDGTRVWAAGEAAAVQAVRRHLFDERGIPRDHTWVRGYWKRGRGEPS